MRVEFLDYYYLSRSYLWINFLKAVQSARWIGLEAHGVSRGVLVTGEQCEGAVLPIPAAIGGRVCSNSRSGLN